MKYFFILLVKAYQLVISPFLGKNCRFYPSCSAYSIESIKKHGAFIGGIKSILRVAKCNPLNKGGVDLP